MGRVEGKVALITGAGRGQGRSHAVRLAEEGARIVATDICSNLDPLPYRLSTEEDLETTAELVRKAGGEVITRRVDVRDHSQLTSAVSAAMSEFGRLDIVCANAGVSGDYRRAWEVPQEVWQLIVDVNLTGVWNTLRAVAPALIEQNSGGSIIVTASYAGLNAIPNSVSYTASKHGATGLMKSFAVELAPYSIRVNSVHPSTVITPMIDHPTHIGKFTGDPTLTIDATKAATQRLHAMPIPWLESSDISEAVLWLASDDARFVTGVALPVDAGANLPFRVPHLS